jgi:hydrogenase-4 component B
MLAPMALLALLCLAGGLFPGPFLSLVQPVLAGVAPLSAGFPGLAIPPALIALGGAGLLCLALVLLWYLRRRQLALPPETGPTWGCGYLAPAASMQYSGTSFGALFGSFSYGVIRTRVTAPALAGVAPAPARLSYRPEETLLERFIMPALQLIGVAFSFLRRLQHGEVQIYIIYIFVTLVALMVWIR